MSTGNDSLGIYSGPGSSLDRYSHIRVSHFDNCSPMTLLSINKSLGYVRFSNAASCKSSKHEIFEDENQVYIIAIGPQHGPVRLDRSVMMTPPNVSRANDVELVQG
jgi:hypothetical protein